jgi:TfoX/Sxy family transcriptional regulator of competence genes
MTYDKVTAERIRHRIGERPDLVEREMFGGLAFLIGGNMAVGLAGDELMVRVGKEAHDAAVTQPGARIMDFTTRPMRGWITVAPDGFRPPAMLDAWVDQGVAFAERLPRKRAPAGA